MYTSRLNVHMAPRPFQSRLLVEYPRPHERDLIGKRKAYYPTAVACLIFVSLSCC